MQKLALKQLLRRYFIFVIGLLLNSFGVAFVTKATLGTTPIAAIPYSLSLQFTNLTMGEWTIIFSLVLVGLQPLLLRKVTNKIQLLLQIVISFGFGYFIDLSMALLKGFLPTTYLTKLVVLLIGCLIIAFGAYFEVIADVVMLPGDAFVRVIAKITHREYGSIRVLSDISMTVIGALICSIFLQRLLGVREGTIIAALIVGNIVKWMTKHFRGLTYLLLVEW